MELRANFSGRVILKGGSLQHWPLPMNQGDKEHNHKFVKEWFCLVHY